VHWAAAPSAYPLSHPCLLLYSLSMVKLKQKERGQRQVTNMSVCDFSLIEILYTLVTKEIDEGEKNTQEGG
jgi:hypothetical protein